MSRAAKAIDLAAGRETRRLKRELAAERKRADGLADTIDKLTQKTATKYKAKTVKPRKRAKATKHLLRVIVPDSHGEHIDTFARDAFLNDLTRLRPDEMILLGDHLDCGGTFNSHQRNYTNEMTESYADDVAATNDFFDKMQERAPSAEWFYMEGNHEQHVERWAARNFHSHKDARLALDRFGPAAVLDLKGRGIQYFKRSEFYCGLSVPGLIKRGKCHYVHGISHAKHAASKHLERVGGNVCFGHVHRSQSVCERNVSSDGYGAWCPGTLAKLQPLYRHTQPSDWQHGYGVQFANARTGKFMHWNVPIMRDVSLLLDVIDAIAERSK